MKSLVRNAKKHPFPYILYSIIILLVMVSHSHQDLLATQRHGITVWTALFDGHLFDFYQYCEPGGVGHNFGGGAIVSGVAGCAYDFTFYLVFALWNFPLWVVEKIAHINVQQYTFAIFWGKLMLLVFLLLTGSVFVKCYSLIRKEQDLSYEEDDESLIFLSLISSLLFTVYTMTSGNYDVVNAFFMLLGFYFFLKNRYWSFVACYAVSASLKYFGILLFLPLLLLKQKNFLKIFREILAILSLSVLEKILFTPSTATTLQKTSGGYFLGRILEASTGGIVSTLGIGNISLFFMLIGGICIYAYLIPSENFTGYRATYISALCWISFLFFMDLAPYWSVIAVPFLLLLVLTCRRQTGFLLLLELGFSTLFYFSYSITISWVISGHNFLGLFLYNTLTVPLLGGKLVSGYNIGDILMWINQFFPCRIYLNSAALLFAIAILWLTRIGHDQETEVTKSAEKMFPRDRILWIRFYFTMALTILPVVLYVLQIIFYHQLSGK